MKTILSHFFLPITIFIFANSCKGPECINTNPIFNKFMPGTEKYKSELSKQLQLAGTGKLSYWFDEYLKKGNKEFIIIQIQGTDLCAKAEIEVKDWSKINAMRREISGYRGAELKGLEIEIKQDSMGTHFIFEDVTSIID